MSTLVILATLDEGLASSWEAQIPQGRVILRVGEEGLPRNRGGMGAVLILDSALEPSFREGIERCCTIYIGEPRTAPFEQAKMDSLYKVFLSYEESRKKLGVIFPLVEEIVEKQSIVNILSTKGRREDGLRAPQKIPSVGVAEIWDFIEGAVESIESRDRLVGEFRRASRHILRASHAVFFLREADGFRADRGTSFFSFDDPLVFFFENHPAVVDDSLGESASDPVAELAVRNRMAMWGARLLVPIHDNGRLLGLIALGVREDGQSYDDADHGRAILFARLLRNLLAKNAQFGRLANLANQVALGSKYFPGTLVLSADEGVPRHVPLIVRDLIGQVRRTRELMRAAPFVGQPFRASAGIIAENGGIWAFWEEASGEIHDARVRERASRRALLRELSLTLSHELGNSLVSLAIFRQIAEGRVIPDALIETIKRDIAYLETLNGNLEMMQRLHESEPSAIDVREIAQAVGQAVGVRVEVGPDPVILTANRQLLEFTLVALIRTLAENRPEGGVIGLVVKVRSTGVGGDVTALISLNGKDLELEGVLPEPSDDAVPTQGRMGVFLAKEILRLHNGEIHAGPGIEGTEILVSFKSW